MVLDPSVYELEVCRRSTEGRLLPWCERECFLVESLAVSLRVAAFRLLRALFSSAS